MNICISNNLYIGDSGFICIIALGAFLVSAIIYVPVAARVISGKLGSAPELVTTGAYIAVVPLACLLLGMIVGCILCSGKDKRETFCITCTFLIGMLCGILPIVGGGLMLAGIVHRGSDVQDFKVTAGYACGILFLISGCLQCVGCGTTAGIAVHEYDKENTYQVDGGRYCRTTFDDDLRYPNEFHSFFKDDLQCDDYGTISDADLQNPNSGILIYKPIVPLSYT